MKGVDLERHKKAMEERARQERDEKRRKMFGGADYVGDEGDFTVHSGQDKPGCLKRFYEKVNNFLDRLTPLRSDIRKITVKYDKMVESYFVFFRFLVAFSLFVLLLFAWLIIWHLFNFDHSWSDVCNGFMPCFLYYSRFSNSTNVIYGLTLVVFVFLGAVGSLYKWVRFDEVMKRGQLYDTANIRFSKMLFNSMDFTLAIGAESRDNTTQLLGDIRLQMDEDKIKAVVAERTREQKAKLYVRRAIFITVNLIILCLGWAVIFGVNLYSKEIQDSVNGVVVLSSIANFIPTFVMSFVNGFVPTVTKKITVFEKYDFASTLMKQQVIRNYATKILNIAIFTVINVELAMGDAFFRS